jgi:hypothetical protein
MDWNQGAPDFKRPGQTNAGFEYLKPASKLRINENIWLRFWI